MHRASQSQVAHRAYYAGGSKSVVEAANDGPLMQEMKGSGLKNQGHDKVESPQNYGFTSVVADGDKDKDGNVKQGAETTLSYMGGNTSLPMAGNMDDRRHRLKALGDDAAKGSSAMYGLKEWGQQYLNTKDGQFITGNKEKKNRMQLVENKNGKKQPTTSQPQASAQGLTRNADGRLAFRSNSGVEFEIEEFESREQPGVSTLADSGSSGDGRGGGGGEQPSQDSGKPTGQKTLHKEDSDIAVEQNGKETYSQHGQFYSAQRSGSDASTYHESRKKSAQATDAHVHVRFELNRIWVDKDGHWSESPILQKKDPHCKE